MFSSIIIVSAFGNRSFNENVYAINCTNNLRGFVLIFRIKYFNSNRYFDSALGKFNGITGNLDNFLTREKSFVLEVFQNTIRKTVTGLGD